MMKWLITPLILILILVYSVQAQTPFIISDSSVLKSIGLYTEVFKDNSGKLTIQQILAQDNQGKFTQSKQNELNFGVTRAAIWSRFTITNMTNENLYLFSDDPILDSLFLYTISEKTLIEEQCQGQFSNLYSRKFQVTNFLYDLHLQNNETKTFYLRALCNATMQVPLKIGTMRSIMPYNQILDLFHGCYYGFVLLIILYNLFVYFSVKDKAYLYYICYVFSLGLFNCYINGHALLFFGERAFLLIGNYIISIASIVLTLVIIFTSQFLQTARNIPRLHKGLYVMVIILAIPLLVEVFGNKYDSDSLAHVAAMLVPTYLLYCSARVYFKGYKPAKYYLIAWSIFLICCFVFASSVMGLIPFNDITKKTLIVGSSIEMFLISIALADKINLYKAEKDEAQLLLLDTTLENERIVRNQNVVLEKKVLERTVQLHAEKNKSDELLYNILPEGVAEELKKYGKAEAKNFDEVTVLFTDFVNFTGISEKLSPKDLVSEIGLCFSAFDEIIERNGLEKIKTIGDAYMAVSGLPYINKFHAINAAKSAIEILNFINMRKAEGGKFEIRIGLHSGPVIAGIVGNKKFSYDIWGDTVNLASRMESSSETGKINISGATYELIKHEFDCIYRGKIAVKNKGEIDMYFVNRSLSEG